MALNNVQQFILKELAKSPLRNQFYWAGGTLLSEKYLHHRVSHDIDLFSEKPFDYQEVAFFVETIQKKTKLKFVEKKKVFDRWEFFLHNHTEVRIEFVHYNFPALRPRKLLRGVRIDSLEDLAANKIMAVVDRNEPKDVIDIYFLMTSKKFSIKKMLNLAKKKFGLTMDESTVLGEILRKSQRLSEIEPLLYGTVGQQKKLMKSAQAYFADLSAKCLRRYFYE